MKDGGGRRETEKEREMWHKGSRVGAVKRGSKRNEGVKSGKGKGGEMRDRYR